MPKGRCGLPGWTSCAPPLAVVAREQMHSRSIPRRFAASELTRVDGSGRLATEAAGAADVVDRAATRQIRTRRGTWRATHGGASYLKPTAEACRFVPAGTGYG